MFTLCTAADVEPTPAKNAHVDQDAIYAKVLPMSYGVCYHGPCSYADVHTNSISVQIRGRETGKIVSADAPGC